MPAERRVPVRATWTQAVLREASAISREAGLRPWQEVTVVARVEWPWHTRTPIGGRPE